MIRLLRVSMIAAAIVLGVAGFTLSALILAVGSIAMAPFDRED